VGEKIDRDVQGGVFDAAARRFEAAREGREISLRRLKKYWRKIFRQKAQQKALPESFSLRKFFTCDAVKQTEETNARQLTFTISTASPDRYKDVVEQNGWDLTNFNKAGVVLWAHNSFDPPVAKPIKTWVEDGKLKSIAEFLDKDFADHSHVKFADMIFKMYKAGILRATSVGFQPTEYTWDEARGGYNFLRTYPGESRSAA
jgi:hypothetical protein